MDPIPAAPSSLMRPMAMRSLHRKILPRWMKGSYCDPRSNRYRQHPLDYIEVLEESIREALSKSPEGVAEKVVGMGFDTTGSTPVLTDEQGTPWLCYQHLPRTPMPCSYSGKTILRSRRLTKSTNWQSNGKSIIPHSRRHLLL